MRVATIGLIFGAVAIVACVESAPPLPASTVALGPSPTATHPDPAAPPMSTEPTDSVAVPSTPLPPRPTLPAHLAQTLVDCASVQIVAASGSDTLLSLEHHVLQLDVELPVGGARSITVRYLDPACRTHPSLGPVIEHVLRDAMEGRAEECADLERRLRAGEAGSVHGEVDLGALRRYYDSICPPRP